MPAVTASGDRIPGDGKPEFRRLRLSEARFYRLLKTEGLGTSCWRISVMRDPRYDTVPRVFKGQWYGWHDVRGATRTATLTCSISGATPATGSSTSTGSTIGGFGTTASRSSETLFVLPLSFWGGSLFFCIFYPTSEHSADLV